jgi:hypothetical protein
MATSANATFSKVKSYNVAKFDVEVGQKFTVELIDAPTPVDWFSKADEVLAIKQDGAKAEIEATAVGATQIRIYNSAEQKILELSIEVFETLEPAADLGLKVGEPETKKKTTR